MWFALHHHSRYSAMDGIGGVAEGVARAAELGHPAIGLTDHGTMAGVAELYTAAREHGIKPLPGIEAYASYGKRTRKTFHLCLVATSEQGYINLVRLNNKMQEDFYFKPILDLTDLAGIDTSGVIATTGCHFGVMQSAYRADPDAALNVTAALAEYFDTYVEAQCHGISEQDDAEQEVALQISTTLGLPLVLGQDDHYPYLADRPRHDSMKRLGSWSDDPDSAVFPGRYGYQMVSASTARRWYHPAVWEAGMAGMAQIVESANVVIPPLDRFDPVLVKSGRDDETLSLSVRHFLAQNVSLTHAHDDRAREELATIKEFGFAGYLLLVAEITDYCRDNGIMINIRGSAAGSIVCWALGITELDPLKWGLGFDRFLSRDRAKLPDIDIDVDSTRREEVIDYLRRTYVVRPICLYSELGVDMDEETGKWKGSAVVKWHQAQAKTGGSHVITNDVALRLRDMCGGGRVIAQRGKHAAGLVVAPDEESMRWLPMAVIGSEKTAADKVVTAFDMSSVEGMGYVKIDLLGLKALTAVSHCEAATGIRRTDIPLDDEDVFTMISAGRTSGVFQLEGFSARRGCQKMKPRRIEEVIDAMALFRPATISSGATQRYVRRLQSEREGVVKLGPVSKLHSDIVDVVAPTKGEMLYQEQMIDVLKAAGLGPDELGKALKAIKASNANTGNAGEAIRALMDRLLPMAAERGWSKKSVAWLEHAFLAYAGYSFNRAHATSYGLLAYQTAWFAHHHPGPFFAGMIMAHSGNPEKVEVYTRALRERGFTEAGVDVNHSGVHIRVDVATRKLYPSLLTVKGVGGKSAAKIEEAAPFSSVEDFAVRLAQRGVSGAQDLARGTSLANSTGVVGALVKAGALDALV